jgi:hypothetical protein
MKKSSDAKPRHLPAKAPDFTRTAWAEAHRKQRPQQKVSHLKGKMK